MRVNAYVMEVIDGDTFGVSGVDEKIRLENIDTPEIDKPGGESAKRRLEELILNRNIVYEEKAHDVYGRIVAQVWVDSINVNDAMDEYLTAP